MITTQKNEWVRISAEYYTGSLDFPCDFCELNSYRNFHISKDSITIVVCEDCLIAEKTCSLERVGKGRR